MTSGPARQRGHYAAARPLGAALGENARLCHSRSWESTRRTVSTSSAIPESLGEWSKSRRADGKLISLALARLPNGATVVTFSDLTDFERFTAEQNASKQITHEGESNFGT